MKIKDIIYQTPLNDLHLYQIQKIIDLSIDWCINQFGVRKWCPEFNVTALKNKKVTDFGWYVISRHDPEITINIASNKDVKCMIDTIIHEYTHYLESDFGNLYKKYEAKYDEANNPLEIKAEKTAIKYRRKCFKYVKELI
jgi:hypothetical protein